MCGLYVLRYAELLGLVKKTLRDSRRTVVKMNEVTDEVVTNRRVTNRDKLSAIISNL